MRSKLVAGNWKSNGNLSSNAALLQALKDKVISQNAEVIICPPAVYMVSVATDLEDSKIGVGAQNCSAYDAGAYTGEVTAEMLRDTGASAVIVGHSERRLIFSESNADIAHKVERVVGAGLKPILCIGETLEEREAGQAEAVCLSQLDYVISKVQLNDSWVIAYEPVWAIGTGKTASAADAQAMHKVLRDYLQKTCGDVAGQVKILYGGSVKPSNAKELFEQADIDGALVGGASLSAEDFVAIIDAASN